MIDGQKAPCDEGVIDAAGRAATCLPRDRPWVLAATILGSSLAFITGLVVNVALPAIQRALGASAGDMQWVVNGYLLFLSALILVGGLRLRADGGVAGGSAGGSGHRQGNAGAGKPLPHQRLLSEG